MNTLLFIEASPRHAQSYSSHVAAQFVERLVNADPHINLDRLDLWSTSLPEFDGELLEAKYAVLGKQEHSADQAEAWAGITRIAERFIRATIVVIATPMWNKSIPYRLKHYIDLITQPGITFSFSPQDGYRGLTPNRPVILFTASAGIYSGDSPLKDQDFLLPYLENWLNFIGISKLSRIEIAPTVGPQENIATAVANAITQAEVLAQALIHHE